MDNLQYQLKESAKEEVVGFNGSGLPLGERSDVAELAAMAVRTNNPELKKYFDKLPTLQEVNSAQEDAFLAAQPAVPSFDDLVHDPEAEAKATAEVIVEASTDDREVVETGNEVVPVVTPETDAKADNSEVVADPTVAVDTSAGKGTRK